MIVGVPMGGFFFLVFVVIEATATITVHEIQPYYRQQRLSNRVLGYSINAIDACYAKYYCLRILVYSAGS